MSKAERDRAHLVRDSANGRLGQREASERLGIGVRQFKRLVRAWKQDGDAGLVSRQRGRPSNNRLDEDRLSWITALLQDKLYRGFGATLMAETLLDRHGIKVSAETIRQMQIRLKLWRPKSRRAKRVFPPRERRPRSGELIQIDGSPHDWFEGRGPRCTLIVFIDDATNHLTSLWFAPSETTKAYLAALRGHVLAHGVPLAFYSDRHGIFRINAKDAQSGALTEFGHVAERLRIEPIQARTPQAKGRVERANETLQDRFVKQMRLDNISSIEEANAYSPVIIARWNKRFGVAPRNEASAHRPWTGTPEALDDVLARREERVLSKALTFSSAGTKYCVKTSGPGTALRGAKITLHHFADGTMTVHYKDRMLQVTAYGHYPVPDPVEDEKTINARLDAVIAAAPGAAGLSPAPGLR